MILADHQIADLAAAGMIDPFYGFSVKGPGGTSFGLSSAGYDIRVGNEWVEYRGREWFAYDAALDPANVTERDVRRIHSDEYMLPAGGFVLAHTMETFALPRDILGKVTDKSTLARAGVTLQTTVLEPGWGLGEVIRPQLTLEIFNNSPRAVLLRAGQGIAQILFFRTSAPCRVSYADRKGKYSSQQGVTLPRSGK